MFLIIGLFSGIIIGVIIGVIMGLFIWEFLNDEKPQNGGEYWYRLTNELVQPHAEDHGWPL